MLRPRKSPFEIIKWASCASLVSRSFALIFRSFGGVLNLQAAAAVPGDDSSPVVLDRKWNVANGRESPRLESLRKRRAGCYFSIAKGCPFDGAALLYKL